MCGTDKGKDINIRIAVDPRCVSAALAPPPRRRLLICFFFYMWVCCYVEGCVC